MYRSASVAIMAPSDQANLFLSGPDSTIPVISFGPIRAESFDITLNSQTMTPAEHAAWLRGFAAQLEDLAEQIENRHGLTTSTVSEFTCEGCGSMFGIAGFYTGSPEDVAADEHYRSQVEFHTTGQCALPTTKTAAQ